MTKKSLLIGSGTLLAVASFIASAAFAGADNVASSVVVVSPIAPVACPVFSRSLSLGTIGNDVTNLQQYLNGQGFLSVDATGYFGPLTQAAVAKWQAAGGVVGLGGFGSGFFGPLSRAYFSRSCGSVGGPGGGSGSGGAPQSPITFFAGPGVGTAPLTVEFNVTAPQGTTVGNSVNFGDGTSGNLGFVPVCSKCNLLATVSHTYVMSGIYTAQLTSGNCTCPANGICNCPALIIIATTSVTVLPAPGSGSNSSSTTGIQQLNAPGNVSLAVDGIAEVRNANFYFILTGETASTATINVTQVGCWNSFPSDPIPQIHCMIAVVPVPPQTLSVGQQYQFLNRSIMLTGTTSGTATFSVQ